MSILNSLTNEKDKFVIPRPGKMFRSTLAKKSQALAFCLNKGYFEFEQLSDLYIVIEQLKDSKTFVLVGEIDKIVMIDGSYRYRQRIFFKSLLELIDCCRKNVLTIEISEEFNFNINSVMNCLDELVYLERYSNNFSQDINEYLKYTCICRLYLVFEASRINYNLNCDIDSILENKFGYLDRAPFVISSYNIDDKMSSIFLDDGIDDIRLYSMRVDKLNSILFGYTSETIKIDINKGCFR